MKLPCETPSKYMRQLPATLLLGAGAGGGRMELTHRLFSN